MLVAVASAEGEMFTQRRDTLNRLLRSLGLSAVYATAVAREMVAGLFCFYSRSLLPL